jgi:hypothetical protein
MALVDVRVGQLLRELLHLRLLEFHIHDASITLGLLLDEGPVLLVDDDLVVDVNALALHLGDDGSSSPLEDALPLLLPQFDGVLLPVAPEVVLHQLCSYYITPIITTANAQNWHMD